MCARDLNHVWFSHSVHCIERYTPSAGPSAPRARRFSTLDGRSAREREIDIEESLKRSFVTADH